MISVQRLKLESSNFACRYTVLNPSLHWQTTPKIGEVRLTWPIFYFDARNHIYVTAEARVAKFCMQVESIKCWSNCHFKAALVIQWRRGPPLHYRMTDYPLMGVVEVTWPVLFNFTPIISLESVKLALQMSCSDWNTDTWVLVHAWYITPT